ncbi:MAG: L-rhamnose mutarotase [Cyclobacteriaceae bacterium]|nr:L-rhamnose mutarotase [Cyclobacteriaceae bacterium]
MKYKRYCKTLKLAGNAALIEKYKKAHESGKVWPEISQGMKEVGIIDMEIYIHDTSLFMIMDTVPGFDHDQAMKTLATLPRQSEWETRMAEFQLADQQSSAGEKWQLMERIYELDQEKTYSAREGQRKEFGLR